MIENEIFKALADPTRRAILDKLAAGSMNASELREGIAISQPAMSQHLAVLRERGLVETERDGLNVIYSLRYPELLDAIDRLREVLRSEMRRRGALGD